MTDIYIDFDRLPAKQIFNADGREWVKCPTMMKWEDIVFNAFVNIEELISAGKPLELQVRLFDSDDIVHIDSNRELFIHDITSSTINSNDN